MADFGGWEMPIEYPASDGGGVVAELRVLGGADGFIEGDRAGKVGHGKIDEDHLGFRLRRLGHRVPP